MENMKIKCRNCGNEFEFTVGEQKFYEERGFATPVRCKECREARKAKENAPKNDIEALLDKFHKNTVRF